MEPGTLPRVLHKSRPTCDGDRLGYTTSNAMALKYIQHMQRWGDGLPAVFLQAEYILCICSAELGWEAPNMQVKKRRFTSQTAVSTKKGVEKVQPTCKSREEI